MGFNRWPESWFEPSCWALGGVLSVRILYKHVPPGLGQSRTHAIFCCPRCFVTFHRITLSRASYALSLFYHSYPFFVDRLARCFCTLVTGSRYRCNFGEGNFLRDAWKKKSREYEPHFCRYIYARRFISLL